MLAAHPTRILLVEAGEPDARSLGGALRYHSDWEVVRATSLLDAIRAAGGARFDAAILDADLPDGSGLDILDFLRIGSPDIRILLCSARADERTALDAIRRGAGDVLLKDGRTERELPRRLAALLERPSDPTAHVDALTPSPRAPRPATANGRIAAGAGLGDVLAHLVRGTTRGAGVWDPLGRPVAALLPQGGSPEGLGFALATLHSQMGALHAFSGLTPTGYHSIVDVEHGLLAITAIPGTYIVALLLDEDVAREDALAQLARAADVVLAALHDEAGGAGPSA